ncbi:Cobra venom factor, partial [Ophiophagus hannah]
LTAYVVKIFALAAKTVKDISHEIICGGVRWLILSRQQPDGVFKENAPVLSGTMQGGIQGAEPEVCLTGFTLVALLESRSICNEYINVRDVVMGSVKSHHQERNCWEEYNAHTHNIEGTSYALLALLKMKKFVEAGPVVKWLIDQKYYGGTYGQTQVSDVGLCVLSGYRVFEPLPQGLHESIQATVMVFQALAEYEIQMPTHKDLNLDIVIKLPERNLPLRYRLDATNAILARTAEVQYFSKYLKQAKGAKGALKLKICTRYLGEVDSTMTIIDVSLLTGFVPDAEDLMKLSKGVDRYISKFEINNNMAQKGTVIIYLD